MKFLIEKIPMFDKISRLYWSLPRFFQSSENYWEQRYAQGGDSGAGSFGKFAEFKADVINRFIKEHSVSSVIEFGCGDGSQLQLANYPHYTGFDISETAIALCQEKFAFDATKKFLLMKEYMGERADLTLSLDVIYHLVEDDVFENHMKILFDASERYAVIYSSDSDNNYLYWGAHVRNRKFSNWISKNRPNWNLLSYQQGVLGSFANFYIYEKS